ncbi:MAG: UPF0158 family protein [Bacteroidota bacterium]|nr:UPF0158 family protein [Bacteroidota bacterium]
MKLTDKQINKMAQDLEAGMKIFINKETLEYRTILDLDDLMDPEFLEEEMEKIENEWSNYAVIEKMNSSEAFKIMEDFVDEVKELKIKENLIKILNRKSPFANFKAEIESSNYREEWFAFRTKRHEDYVKEQLDMNEI